MSRQVQIRRGSTADLSTFAGAEAEISYDTTKKTLVAHDGVTPGGFPLAKEIAAGAVDGVGIFHIVKIFQRDYDLLSPPDEETLYVIVPLRFNLEGHVLNIEISGMQVT